MDYELLVALWVLWVSSTMCLFACAFMWLMNEGICVSMPYPTVTVCRQGLCSAYGMHTYALCWLYLGEAFHPHSVDIEWRHNFYQVVKSNTKCKVDFAVKSVSEFIAAR